MCISLLLPSARRIKEVVDANPLKLMSAIDQDSAHMLPPVPTQTPPPSLLFCRENSFTPSIHPAPLMIEMERVFIGCICCPPGCVPLHLSPFLASQPDPWASSHSQTLPFRDPAAALVPPMILQSGWALKE